MPAPVPPGYTRGPILFIGKVHSSQAETTLFQRFWVEAGGYGARILLIPSLAPPDIVAHWIQLFRLWDVDTIEVLDIRTRQSAQQEVQLPMIEQATAILFLDADPQWLARTLGGTPVAQTIRRANARGKIVGSMGDAGNVLCQHMLLYPGEGAREMTFAPGLGLVNRIAIAHLHHDNAGRMNEIHRLLTTLRCNPFLIGVGLEPDTGFVIYPDATLEVFGANRAILLDGAATLADEWPANPDSLTLKELGVHIHYLTSGYTFNFDLCTSKAPLPSDIPEFVTPLEHKSPF